MSMGVYNLETSQDKERCYGNSPASSVPKNYLYFFKPLFKMLVNL